MRLHLAVIAALACVAPSLAHAQDTPTPRSRFDLGAVQGILAVQQLDGWLLYDNRGQNPIAVELVNPAGKPVRRWFYLVPARGQPVALVHKSELTLFDAVPGRKLTYTGHRDLKRGLRAMLKGIKRVSMEYAPKSSIPSLTRIDAGTARLVASQGIRIRSSAQLVQFTKSLWGPKGRIAHYIAAHHLDMLRRQALALIARRVVAGRAVTEEEVQQFMARGFKVRGIVGGTPVVAAGINTSDPNYAPLPGKSALIKKGDLVAIRAWARMGSGERPIVADITWMAYVGVKVPERYAKLFKAVATARDAALGLIKRRIQRRRAVKGYEPDQTARAVIGKAGYAANFVHRTGHSLDMGLHGDGANLDDYETHDTRILVLGSGFTIGPGIYFKGELGLRAEINVHIARHGVEVTTVSQSVITPILAAP